MKKEEAGNSNDETKTTLKWRLQSKVSLDDVTTMLDKGIIDKEEAKQMLFSEEKPLTRDETVKALQEQVEFQKTVIEKLMEKPAPVVWSYINTYTPRYPWNGLTYARPVMLTGSLNNTLMNTITTTAGAIGKSGTTTTAYYSVNNGGGKVIDA